MSLKKKGRFSKITVLISLICIILIIFAGIYIYFRITSSMKIKYEKLLSDEVYSMYTTKSVEGTIKSKGDFSIVEQGIKQYYSEYLNNIKELKNVYSENSLNNCLSATNIKKDGPEFVATSEIIEKIKNQESITIKNIETLSSDDYINNKAKELNLNEYYTNLFISQIKENLLIEDSINNVRDIITGYNNWLDSIEKILCLLKDNKLSWKVNDDKIVFNSTTLLNQYNTGISNIQTVETTLRKSLNNL